MFFMEALPGIGTMPKTIFRCSAVSTLAASPTARTKASLASDLIFSISRTFDARKDDERNPLVEASRRHGSGNKQRRRHQRERGAGKTAECQTEARAGAQQDVWICRVGRKTEKKRNQCGNHDGRDGVVEGLRHPYDDGKGEYRQHPLTRNRKTFRRRQKCNRHQGYDREQNTPIRSQPGWLRRGGDLGAHGIVDHVNNGHEGPRFRCGTVCSSAALERYLWLESRDQGHENRIGGLLLRVNESGIQSNKGRTGGFDRLKTLR